MNQSQINARFWQIIFALLWIALAAAALEIAQTLDALGVLFSLRSFWWLVVIVSSIFVVLGLLGLWTHRFLQGMDKVTAFYQVHHLAHRKIAWSLFVALAIGFGTWVILGGYIVLNGYFVRIFIYYLIALVGMFLLQPTMEQDAYPVKNQGMGKSSGRHMKTPIEIRLIGHEWPRALLASLLMTAGIYRLLVYLPQISASPFSLGWSEGSRYYYGSLYFSKALFGQKLPLSPWHPTRYMLLALPFFIKGLPIWAHRLWQVLLWMGLTGAAGWSLARRLNLAGRLLTWLFTIWAFLFLLQGPVYYHLEICLIIIWLGVNFDKPKQTFWVVLAASMWAGLSRVNWIPVPLFLATTLYLLEVPWPKVKPTWRYLLPPLKWSLGIPIAFLASSAYVVVAGNDLSKFGSSFTSALLWNRLWPSATFGMGIFTGVLLLTLPLLVLCAIKLKARAISWHPLKLWGLGTMLLTLFAGGLVVSVKIGGGSNLHNMDAYFVLLLTLGSYLLFGRLNPQIKAPALSSIVSLVSILVVVTPILVTLHGQDHFLPWDQTSEAQNLQLLQQLYSETKNQNGQVLFIAERQLQVFKDIPASSLSVPYEKMELMEMAMSDNQAYLENFYHDIASQKYALIVTDPMLLTQKRADQAFSEENNIWVEKVAVPMMKYYQLHPAGVHEHFWILVPKP